MLELHVPVPDLTIVWSTGSRQYFYSFMPYFAFFNAKFLPNRQVSSIQAGWIVQLRVSQGYGWATCRPRRTRCRCSCEVGCAYDMRALWRCFLHRAEVAFRPGQDVYDFRSRHIHAAVRRCACWNMRYSGLRVWRGVAEVFGLQHARCGMSIGLPTTLLCLAYESCADMNRWRRSVRAGGGRMLFVMELSASISAWCCWCVSQEQK